MKRTTAPHIRKRPVSFGNPALSTYNGTVFTTDTAQQQPPLIEGAVATRSLVCMVQVPPEQVPEGILNVARSHRPWIHHVRIVIAQEETDEQPQQLQTGKEKATSMLAETEENDESFVSSTSCTSSSAHYLVLLQMASEEAANLFVEDLHRQPYTALDETQICFIHHVVALQGKDGVSLMSPFFAPSDGLDNKKRMNESTAEDYHCAVCLERMDLSEKDGSTSILTTVCNHSFHLDCLLQWQDSPCPVCRYDHSGLNEALSQCHVCGRTENNYVCLICGVVSCGGRSSVAGQQQSCQPTAPPNNLMRHSHARQHYDETLHAYALDTESQHVWDFAGQGYVHRLLQNKEDGKLVEVSDPNNTTSEERTLDPGLSEEQSELIVHRKLEGFASQYYTLLKSQLEQQRIYYEGRLEEIRHEYAARRERQTSELIVALRHERQHLMNRLGSLKSKMRKVQGDVTFLRDMNESLEANKAPLRQQIEEAKCEQAETRQLFHEILPPLQEKVTRLMLQLESEFEDSKPSSTEGV